MRPSTAVVHRFFEFVIVAEWHGYYVKEHSTTESAVQHVREIAKHALYVEDWHQFRMQSPCEMPESLVEAVLAWYTSLKS